MAPSACVPSSPAFVKNGVRTGPGQTALIRTPTSAFSRGAPLVGAQLASREGGAVTGVRRFRGVAREGIVELVDKAIEANRIDLYLQPIVTLPQRKVRHYEALSRLRTEDGEIVPAGDFIDTAESAGLMPKLDNLLLFRCVQLIRRTRRRDATGSQTG